MTERSRWGIVLDPESSEDARKAAWRSLRKRARPAILFQLRRRIEGWRKTEELADEFCERVLEAHRGRGAEGAARLREVLERELIEFLGEQGHEGPLDDEFERDWASSLCAAALKELGRADPDAQRLLLRLYDGPEGQAPLRAEDLAGRLGVPPEEVARVLSHARNELRKLFEREVGTTVADAADTAAETDCLMPRAKALFGT